MLGIVLRHQVLEIAEVEPFGFHLVDQARQLRGEADRVVLSDGRAGELGNPRSAVGDDAGGQQQLALHPGERRRQLGLALSGEGGDRKSTRELQSLMRISYAVFCLTKKNTTRE